MKKYLFLIACCFGIAQSSAAFAQGYRTYRLPPQQNISPNAGATQMYPGGQQYFVPQQQPQMFYYYYR